MGHLADRWISHYAAGRQPSVGAAASSWAPVVVRLPSLLLQSGPTCYVGGHADGFVRKQRGRFQPALLLLRRDPSDGNHPIS